MNVLFAVDGSDHSERAFKKLVERPWPSDTEVRVLSVAHPVPLIEDPLLIVAATHFDSLRDEQKRATEVAHRFSSKVTSEAPVLKVSTEVLEGSPGKLIVQAARNWPADLIIVGSHGHGTLERLLLGSVAEEVAVHAPCSVEIMR